MKKDKRSINELINDFTDKWDVKELIRLFDYIEPLYKLYDVEKGEDEIEKRFGKEDVNNIRLARTVYIISKMCEFFGPKMISTNIDFPKLWKKLEEVKADD